MRLDPVLARRAAYPLLAPPSKTRMHHFIAALQNDISSNKYILPPVHWEPQAWYTPQRTFKETRDGDCLGNAHTSEVAAQNASARLWAIRLISRLFIIAPLILCAGLPDVGPFLTLSRLAPCGMQAGPQQLCMDMYAPCALGGNPCVQPCLPPVSPGEAGFASGVRVLGDMWGPMGATAAPSCWPGTSSSDTCCKRTAHSLPCMSGLCIHHQIIAGMSIF